MINEYMPEHCNERMIEREAVTRNLASAAIMQCSVNEIYLTEQFLGQVSPETIAAANEAGKRYNEAIRGMLNANLSIREIL
jgi:hypothetical protein